MKCKKCGSRVRIISRVFTRVAQCPKGHKWKQNIEGYDPRRLHLSIMVLLTVLAFIASLLPSVKQVSFLNGVYYSEGTEGICDQLEKAMDSDGYCILGDYRGNSTVGFQHLVDCSWGKYKVITNTTKEKFSPYVDFQMYLMNCKVVLVGAYSDQESELVKQ